MRWRRWLVKLLEMIPTKRRISRVRNVKEEKTLRFFRKRELELAKIKYAAERGRTMKVED
jgi:hypothetical protein